MPLSTILDDLTSLPRLFSTGRRAGLFRLGAFGRPLQAVRIAVSRGLGVRAVHSLHAASEPNRAAFIDARRTVTYAEADQEIDAIAAALRDHAGASRHAPVAIMLENRVEYALTWFALFRLGITCAHVSRYSRADELGPLLARSGARVLVVSAATRDVAATALAADPKLVCRLVDVDDDGPRGYPSLLERSAKSAAQSWVVPGPSQNVVYTSGTTGRPKAAVRNFGSFGLRNLLEILDRLPMEVADKHLVVAPLYHSGAQVFTVLNAALGATVVLQEKFDPEEALRGLSEHRANSVFMVPTMIQRVLDLPDEMFARYPTDDLRVLISGAAPFLDPQRRAAIERFGAKRIFDFYGATELGWVTLVGGQEMLARPKTLGRPIPGQEIAVFDGEGRRAGSGEIGVVYTRSVQAMEGYADDAAATDEIRRDDWLTVDDLGYLDDDGYLFLTGRARDMVISGGVNIYPVEIENTLTQHPDVEEVAVVGVEDAKWGERLVAFVVWRGEGPTAEAMEIWAKQRLSSYKVPRDWIAVDRLPRNPTGKVLKRELVVRLQDPAG